MKRTLSLIFTTLLVLNLSYSEIENVPGVSRELAEYRKSILSDISYSLSLTIPRNREDDIRGTLTLTFKLSANRIDLPLDFRERSDKLLTLSLNGEPTQINFTNEHLLLPHDLLKVGENTATIDFVAGESSLNRNPEYLYTLFVPDRARTAFPLFDQPDLKALYQLTLETPADWKAMANSPLEEKVQKETTVVWKYAPSDLISSYLFSFVAGEFESVSQNVNGREMTLLHRETDRDKVERNLDEIFQLHAFSLDWLEDYTGIDYPYQKFEFALIPSFQYGGMEHVGAILYRDSTLFLDEAPSQSQLLRRASLIAHETAHMWFGNLVTMKWFDDVWTKEVFANFMADKIMNPRFPDINHDLNFLTGHYPAAYSVDRTEGANPIRQELPNLNEAGTLYGRIIYDKAPIMMRQLELLLGEEAFQRGMQEYLSAYSFSNGSWPDLIAILDTKTETDLKAWSEVWVNTPGRPEFRVNRGSESLIFEQNDPMGHRRIWPQLFKVSEQSTEGSSTYPVLSESQSTAVDGYDHGLLIVNSDGFGYGLFPQNLGVFKFWTALEDVEKGSALINLYENLLEGKIEPVAYFEALSTVVQNEENQLLLNLSLSHINTLYWNIFSDEKRAEVAPHLERVLWESMSAQTDPSRRKIFFDSWESIVSTKQGLETLHQVWNESIQIENLPFSENDFTAMAVTLAIKNPIDAKSVTTKQLERIQNPDRKRRFTFLLPTLSPDPKIRDAFFDSLKSEANRQVESWVLSALSYLHHPLRTKESEKYILPSLELLQEIQRTGDIFFPAGWTSVILSNYSSDSAVETVREFLRNRPKYNHQLRLKILQSADMLFRTNSLKHSQN